jgi:carboxyl-terminal processing protease
MDRPMRNWPTRPSRLLSLRQILFILLLLTLVGQDSWAQPRVQIPSSAGISGADNLITQGKELESRQQWSAAQDHYREALRQYPDHKDIQALLKTAGVHSDLARRYRDTSFLASLNLAQMDKARDSFAEVLLKIQTHHYEQPRWEAIARQGMRHFRIVLTDPLFLEHHQINPSSTTLKTFLDASDELIRRRQHTRRADLVETIALIARNARDTIQLPISATLLEFTCGTISAMDKYSCYLTPHQLDEMFSQIEGNFVGIGIELKTSVGQLEVIRVISGGPASEEGIQPGDLVLSVDGQTIPEITPDQAADMLRGPDGSQLRITITRAGIPARTITMKRRRVEIPSIEDVRMIDRETGTGYLRITCFQKTTSRDLDDALWRLHRQGMKSLVIDIRDNPGGLLIGSVEVADRFLDHGTIVLTRGRSANEDIDYKAHELGTWNLPIVVLINGNSASASEIFAGAIGDHQRGHVVGRRSYGKGSVQGIFPLSNTSAGIRLTTARFYSPSGRAISNTGITPDVLVQVTKRPTSTGSTSLADRLDPVLDAGLDILRESLAKP